MLATVIIVDLFIPLVRLNYNGRPSSFFIPAANPSWNAFLARKRLDGVVVLAWFVVAFLPAALPLPPSWIVIILLVCSKVIFLLGLFSYFSFAFWNKDAVLFGVGVVSRVVGL